jgi:hypothetical protein
VASKANFSLKLKCDTAAEYLFWKARAQLLVNAGQAAIVGDNAANKTFTLNFTEQTWPLA